MMSSTYCLRSTQVVTGGGVREAAIHIHDGIITAVTSVNAIPSNAVVDDVGNLVVMAGLVDTHVHINEPGRTEWEGFATATQAAAAGGITTLIDMPLNSTPVTTTVEALHQKRSAASGKLWVDCGLYGGAIPGNTDQLQLLIDEGVFGIKAFLIHSGIDDFPNVTEADLRKAIPVIARNQVPLLVHCELSRDEPISQIQHPKSYNEYLHSRPRQWEHEAIALIIRLAEEYSCKVHIVHVSSSDAISMLRVARAKGLDVTTETCPHYLYFTAEEIPDGDTRYKCAPPIRERENKEKLWDAMRHGDLDFIVSDHSPAPPELKCLPTGDFQKAWGGIASLQFGLSVIWTEAKARGFAISDVARWMSERPAEFAGLEKCKGKIAPGYDADLVVWDPDATFVIEPSMIHHRHKLTPYEGKRLFGTVEQTFLRGRNIFDHGTIDTNPTGKLLNRKQIKTT